MKGVKTIRMLPRGWKATLALENHIPTGCVGVDYGYLEEVDRAEHAPVFEASSPVK